MYPCFLRQDCLFDIYCKFVADGLHAVETDKTRTGYCRGRLCIQNDINPASAEDEIQSVQPIEGIVVSVACNEVIEV